MKVNIHLTIFLLVILSTTFNFSANAGNHIMEFFGNQNFQFSENNEVIDIAIAKNPWESFTFTIDNVEIVNNPIVNFEIFSNQSISVRVDLTDGKFMSSEIGVKEETVENPNSFTTLSFDFSEMIGNIDLSEKVYLVFYVNPGKEFDGDISIKNFNLSETPVEQNNTQHTTDGFKMYPSPATSFTNVEIPNALFSALKITDMTGKEVGNFDVTLYAGTTYRVELNNLPKGYYTVQLTDGETAITEKLIIN